MKTTAERMKALRERRKDLGLTELRLWVHPDDERALRDEAAKLQRKRESRAEKGIKLYI